MDSFSGFSGGPIYLINEQEINGKKTLIINKLIGVWHGGIECSREDGSFSVKNNAIVFNKDIGNWIMQQVNNNEDWKKLALTIDNG